MKRFTTLLAALMILSACKGDDGFNKRQTPEVDPDEEIVPIVNPDWTITGPNRYVITENGYKYDIDEITVESVDEEYYYLDIMLDSEFSELYGTDIASYLYDELSILQDLVYYNETTYSSILYKGTQSIQFNRLRSGEWRAVAFGVSTDGELTGDYQMTTLTVEAETASDEFNSWLGSWTFIGADKQNSAGSVSYQVNITSSDPDYIVTINGWETGTGCTNNMTDYSYEAQYDRFTNTLLFMGQYIETYTDDNGTFDFGFYGNFYYDGSGNTGLEEGEYVLTEDVAIAEAFQSTSSSVIEPINLDVYMGDDNYLYETVFTSMQYYDLAIDSDDVYSYNDNIPAFPIVMKKATSATTTTAAANHAATKSLKIGARRFKSTDCTSVRSDGKRTSVAHATRRAR